MARRLVFLGALVAVVSITAVQSSLSAPAASSIHVLGSFNDWDESLWNTDPGMTHVGNLWTDTISVYPWHAQEGYQQFKLVTDRAWDVPPDYCLCPDRLDEYGLLSGPVCLTPYGPNLQMYADVPGRYQMTLDEVALTYSATLIEPFTASITGFVNGSSSTQPPAVTIFVFRGALRVARVQSDPVTGAFTVDQLDGGTYALLFSAFGYQDTVLSGVTVPAGGSIDVGKVSLTSGCVTQFSAIQVVGDFNAWDVNAPSMAHDGCVWTITLQVPAGCYYMKFRTGNVWGNDYGTCTAQDPNCLVPLSGNTCLVNGELALGKINFPATDQYLFRLDEFAGTYQISEMSTPVRSSTWGQLKVRYR